MSGILPDAPGALIVRSTVGEFRWYAILEADSPHPSNALWLVPGMLEDPVSGKPIARAREDGKARFFANRRALVDALVISGLRRVRRRVYYRPGDPRLGPGGEHSGRRS